MKFWVPASIVLTTLLLLCIWDDASMNHRIEHLESQLDTAETLAKSDDWVSARKTLHESYQDWSKERTLLRVISTHSLLDEAETLYSSIIAFAAVEDKGEFLSGLFSLKTQLFLVAERERACLANIF